MANLDKISSDVAGKSADIDQIITDTKQLAGRLNAASVRVDGILQKVDTLLGKPGTESLVAEAHDTLAAYKKMADTINGKLDTIMSGLAQFSGPGLKDVQGFVNDSRHSLQRIEEDITSLSNNPQRIIFGGSSDNVPRYDGRTRH
jgi:phospholipid/cholesterol/gamma-HCH transport system substrate-binding protein